MATLEIVTEETTIELAVISGESQSSIDDAIAAHALLETVHGLTPDFIDAMQAADSPSTANPFVTPSSTNVWTAGQTFQVDTTLGDGVNAFRFTFPAISAGHAAHVIDTGDKFISGVYDPTIAIGYNFDAVAGGAINAVEPYNAIVMENDYNDGSARVVENYMQIAPANGATTPYGTTFMRPWFFQMNRTTGALTYAQIFGDPLQILHPDNTMIADFAKHIFTVYYDQATSKKATFEVDSAGNLLVTPTGTQTRYYGAAGTQLIKSLAAADNVLTFIPTEYSSITGSYGLMIVANTAGYPIIFKAGGVQKMALLANGNLNLNAPTPPASAAATGTTGDIAWDSGFIYVCVGTNSWKRVAIAAW